MSKVWKNLVGLPLFGIALAATVGVNAEELDYYKDITNTTEGVTLASDLHKLLDKSHTHQRSYDQLWATYETSDTLPGTKIIWDTYSDILYKYGTQQDKGNHSKEGDSYNREHLVPQSWFNKDMPMVADAFHILATDSFVNGERSNNLHGLCSTGKTYGNGSRLGTCTGDGYNGKVFEPIDEYKGDIARAYLYMSIRYSDRCGSWSSDAPKIFKSSYPYLTDYAINTYVKWAHEDPVSDKEVIRNDAIAALQGNRNPFIDHPEWVDVIWTNNFEYKTTHTRYSATNVIDEINKLTDSCTSDDVYAAYNKYCRLNTDDKPLVTNADALFTKVNKASGINKDLSTYWSNIVASASKTIDEDKIKECIAQIDTLPDTITLDSEDLVLAVNTTYKRLNNREREQVTNYSKFANAIRTINLLKNKEKIDTLVAKINDLPEVITVSNETLVETLYADYTSLPEDVKEAVTNSTKLINAYNTMKVLTSHTYSLVNNVNELAEEDHVIIVSKSQSLALGAIKSEFYRAGVDVVVENDNVVLEKNTTVVDLVLKKGTSENTFAFYAGDGYLASGAEKVNLHTEEAINDNASYTITISNGIASIKSIASVSAPYMVYDTKYADFSSASADSNDLLIFKDLGASTVDEEKVKAVVELIDSIPATLTLNDKDLVNSCNDAYNALNVLEKNEVKNLDKLNDANQAIRVLEYKENAKKVSDLIDALPDVVTKENSNLITEARAAYDKLGQLEVEYVTNYAKLVEKETEYYSLVGIEIYENTKTMSSMILSAKKEVTVSNSVEAFTLVTDAKELAVGDTIVITSASGEYSLSNEQRNSNRGATAIKKTDNTITPANDTELITLEAGNADGLFALKVEKGYLYAANSGGNQLKSQSGIDSNSSWEITVTDGVASIVAKNSSNRNVLQFNVNNDPKIFSCYKSASQTALAIYKKSAGQTETYSFSKVQLRFGQGMDKSLYDELMKKGTNVSFGVELKEGDSEFIAHEMNPAIVAKLGDAVESSNGQFVQFAAVVNIPSTDYATVITARCYVEIDGVRYYNQEASYSAHTLAVFYINSKTLDLSKDIISMLGVL